MRIKLTYLEIETCNLCNRKCIWCLFGQQPDFRGEEKVYLDDFYLEKVFYELKENNFHGVISFHSMNEPLLDERIVNGSIFKLARSILENCDVALKMTTNGDLLNDEVEKLFESGMDCLYVSCYSEEILRKATNMQKKFSSIAILNFTNNTEKLKFNRAGSIKSHYLGENKKSCMLPLYTSVIGFDGEVRICCNDAIGQLKLGNIKNETLYNILNSKQIKSLRNEICLRRNTVFPCNVCNFDDKSDVDLNPIEFSSN